MQINPLTGKKLCCWGGRSVHVKRIGIYVLACLDGPAVGNAELQKSDGGVDLLDLAEDDMMDIVLARLLRGAFFMTEISRICTRLRAHK